VLYLSIISFPFLLVLGGHRRSEEEASYFGTRANLHSIIFAQVTVPPSPERVRDVDSFCASALFIIAHQHASHGVSEYFWVKYSGGGGILRKMQLRCCDIVSKRCHNGCDIFSSSESTRLVYLIHSQSQSHSHSYSHNHPNKAEMHFRWN